MKTEMCFQYWEAFLEEVVLHRMNNKNNKNGQADLYKVIINAWKNSLWRCFINAFLVENKQNLNLLISFANTAVLLSV